MSERSRQRMLAGFGDSETDPQAAQAPEPRRDLPSENRCTPPSSPHLSSGEDAGGTPASLEGKSVWVVDAHSLIYQVFHAMPDMTSPSGQPIGAVHGFTRDMADLIEKHQPDYLFCAFDHVGDTFRHDHYEKYKANRPSMPDDLRAQIANIHRMLDAMGIATLDFPRYEADDILATIARQTEALGGRCFLVTNDKDCRQLITDRVLLYNIRKNQVYDAAALEKDWGIRPGQVVDFQSLVGDSVDEIPGVPLIGPKIASSLLQKYQNLESVFASVDEVAGKKRRENLKKYSEQALASRQLVRLVDDVPVTIDWKAGRLGGLDRLEVLRLCREFGFRRLGDRLSELAGTDAPKAWQGEYGWVRSRQELESLAQRLAREKCWSMSVIGSSRNPRWARCVGLAFCCQEGEATYVPLIFPEHPELGFAELGFAELGSAESGATKGSVDFGPEDVWAQLGPLLANPEYRKVGHDLKYQKIVLRAENQALEGLEFDSMVADYLLAPGERQHETDDLSRRYFNYALSALSEILGTGKSLKTWAEVPVEAVVPWAGQQADIPLRLRSVLEKQLEEEQLTGLFRELEIPLLEVLAELEFNGICVDVERLGVMSRRFTRRLTDLKREIFELAGSEFNIDSRLQLAKVLFDDLKLPVGKRTKTGPSTDAEVLEQLAQDHALPAKIIEYRQIAKLQGTYVDALPQLVHPATGRVHTSFKQDVAATGHLSSQDPNLQNIPIRQQVGREIRSAFRAGPDDWRLMTADYSQIELRVLAHFCGDESLRKAFAEDLDIHRMVASEIYAVPVEEVTAEMRRNAKTVNFGVIYGQTSFGLAKQLGIEKGEAAKFIATYFSRYEGVEEFITKTLEECRRKGYVSTILGRRRTVEGIRDPTRRRDSRHRNQAERIAINTVIQGSAADLIKRAMIQVYHRMQQEQLQARMLLQIHDELLFELPLLERDRLSRLVTEEMVAAGNRCSPPLSVPLKVDVKSGPTWADCEPLP